MISSTTKRFLRILPDRIGVVGVWLATILTASAQLTERPGNSQDDPIDVPRDLSGLSIKHPRIKVVHTEDPSLLGGSAYLQKHDPWLGYQWGRNLFQREFRHRDGVYDTDVGKLDGVTLADGSTKMMSRSHTNSCAICHNTPYRDAGAGATIAKNGGSGRNTPHLFGAGIVEMIGELLETEAILLGDVNGDGWIAKEEAAEDRCRIGGIDYGSFGDEDGDGLPELNGVFYPVFVDAEGRRIAFATDLHFPGVAGYRLEAQVFGFGRHYVRNRPPIASTLRAFAANTFDLHMGMPAYDPTTLEDADGDGIAHVSNAGRRQPLSQAGRDRGRVISREGVSLDDPDRDGHHEEITEGELDMMEWYLLNHPKPGRGKLTKSVRRGEKHFHQIGCAACHRSEWTLPRDRRFFDLEVHYSKKQQRLEGRLRLRNNDGPITIDGIYSDFKYHEMGPEFAQQQYDGSEVTQWRTTPLWGVAHTAPYGHDGASLTLDDVVRRHGGEATDSRECYLELTNRQQRQIIAFLRSLVLYSVDQLPADINGDAAISDNFFVQDQNTGIERLNPEWLFRIPGRIEGSLPRGLQRSMALTNRREAYGLDLPYLRDENEDGWPDVKKINPGLFRSGDF